jgi:hypothetical protein
VTEPTYRLRIVVNESGDMLQRSVIEFGDHRIPASVRRPGG